MIIRNSIFAFLSLAIPLVIGLFTVPLIISNLGIERFGILTLIWALIGYISIFDLGISRALTKRLTEVSTDKEKSQSIISSALFVLTILGIVLAWVLYTLSKNTNLDAFSIKLGSGEYTYTCLMICISIPFVMFSNGLRAILEGNYRFKEVAAVRLFWGMVTFGAPIFVLTSPPRLDYLVALLVGGRVLGSIALLYFCRHYFPRSLSIQILQSREIVLMLRYGGWLTVSNIVSPIMVYMDRFFVAASPFTNLLAYYTTPYEFVTKLFILPSAITSVIFPYLSRATHIQRGSDNIFLIGCVSTVVILSPVVSFIFLFSYEILAFWLGSSFADYASFPLTILSLGVLVNSIAQVYQADIQATGEVSWIGKLHLIELAFYLPALYFLVSKFGIDSVAILWTTRVSLDALAMIYKVSTASEIKKKISIGMISIVLLICSILIVSIPLLAVTKCYVMVGIILLMLATGLFSFSAMKRFN